MKPITTTRLLFAAVWFKACHGFVAPRASWPIGHLRHPLDITRRQMSSGSPSPDDDDSKDNFWLQQRALLTEMTDRTEKSLRAEQMQEFRQTQGKLVAETAFVSALLFAVLWLACDNPFVPFSYVFGSVFGLAYTYGLGKYVETLGGTAEDALEVQGAGVGQARFAFLILLFVLVGKLRMYGLIEIPSIAGFFTYQIASLTQGLREETA